MRVAITAVSSDLNAKVDPRFGRAACFIVTDVESEEWEVHPNPALEAGGGAGVLAAQFIADKGAGVVISGDFGPNAHQILAAAGIEMFVFPAGEALTVPEVLDLYRDGQLEGVAGPTGPSRHGQ